MVPQHKSVVPGRKVCRTVIDKVRQRLRRPHIGRLPCLGRNLKALSVRHVEDAVVGVGNIAVPPLAASCIDKEIDLIVVNAGSDHLVEVICGGAVPALKIGADNIDHDRVVLVRYDRQLCRSMKRRHLYVHLRHPLVLRGPVIIRILFSHDDEVRFSALCGCALILRACPLILRSCLFILRGCALFGFHLS